MIAMTLDSNDDEDSVAMTTPELDTLRTISQRLNSYRFTSVYIAVLLTFWLLLEITGFV